MKSALIIIDFQNDFISGSLGFEKAVSLREPVKKRVEKAIANGEDLIFTFDSHNKDTYFFEQEGKRLPVAHCLKGSVGWQIDEVLSPFVSKGKIFEKETFGSLELAAYLREKDYQTIELCGLVSSICVLSNAVLAKAACRNARIIVDSRLTEDADEKTKIRSLEVLKTLQIDVIGETE